MDSTTEQTTRLTKDVTADVTADVTDDRAAPFGAPGVPLAVAPAPEPAARPRFRLRRSRTDRMLGGVCGGLAESLGVDAAVIRIGLVALTVLGFGTGIVLYAAVWLLAPETDEP